MTSKEIQAYLERINSKDPMTCNHCGKAAEYAIRLGHRLGLEDRELKRLGIAAILHDLGKLKVPDEILFKPSALTQEEYEVIKCHPHWGAEMIEEGGSDVDYKEVAEIIKHHHERYDGCGYPLGSPGERNPLLAQIISIADAYDAMTSNRPYRSALSSTYATQILYEERGKQFHPELVDVFVDCLTVEVMQ